MGLSSKQIKAIPYLLAAPTIEIGCQKAKISRTQYYQWLQDDDFKAELYRQRNELVSQALNLLSSAMIGATATLVKLLHSRNENVQRLAANNIIDQCGRLSDRQDILERLDKIEKSLEQQERK